MKTCVDCYKTFPLNKNNFNCSGTQFASYCIPCHRIRNKTNNKKHKYRNHIAKYGLNGDSFLKILADQQGKCAICRYDMSVPHVDHDHETGKVRGLLCKTCNLGLGFFQDDTFTLNNAIIYLESQGSMVQPPLVERI